MREQFPLVNAAPGRNLSLVLTPALKVIASPRPLIIGHRGYSMIAPENTLPSFRMAIEAGVDLVELDCRRTADGELMVIHDQELDRTTDAPKLWGGKHLRVETKTSAEIQQLDAGVWFSRRYAGARVPALSEAVEIIRKQSLVLIERKSGEAGLYVRQLRDSGHMTRVIVQSFDWAFLRELHEQEPAQILAALGPPDRLASGRKPPALRRALNHRWLRAIEQTGARVVVWNRQLSASAVRLAHGQGLKVWVYTIDQPGLARRLLAMGVDGLITNDPISIGNLAARFKRDENAGG